MRGYVVEELDREVDQSRVGPAVGCMRGMHRDLKRRLHDRARSSWHTIRKDDGDDAACETDVSISRASLASISLTCSPSRNGDYWVGSGHVCRRD
jgi:hypothetical protein